LAYQPGASNCTDALSQQPDYALNTYNDEPIVALLEHLFVPSNTPTVELQTYPFWAQTLCLDSAGVESTDDPNWNIEATVQVSDIDDNILNHDTKTEVLHMQTQPKHHAQLDTWHVAYNVEQWNNLWWKDDALVVVANDDLRRGVIALFHNSLPTGHPGVLRTTNTISKYYWWPGMCNYITQYIKGCTTCQMNKVNMNPTKPQNHHCTQSHQHQMHSHSRPLPLTSSQKSQNHMDMTLS